MLASQHATVTKSDGVDWDCLKREVEQAMSHLFAQGQEVTKVGTAAELEQEVKPGSIEERILELLEERVKPFVQQDGGDIDFQRFDHSDGSLYLLMQGSCSGC